MAHIEIELKGSDGEPNIVVSRVIHIDNTSTWELNGELIKENIIFLLNNE